MISKEAKRVLLKEIKYNQDSVNYKRGQVEKNQRDLSERQENNNNLLREIAVLEKIITSLQGDL